MEKGSTSTMVSVNGEIYLSWLISLIGEYFQWSPLQESRQLTLSHCILLFFRMISEIRQVFFGGVQKLWTSQPHSEMFTHPHPHPHPPHASTHTPTYKQAENSISRSQIIILLKYTQTCTYSSTQLHIHIIPQNRWGVHRPLDSLGSIFQNICQQHNDKSVGL